MKIRVAVELEIEAQCALGTPSHVIEKVLNDFLIDAIDAWSENSDDQRLDDMTCLKTKIQIKGLVR